MTSYPDFAILEVGQDERTVFTMQPTKYRIDSTFTPTTEGLTHNELEHLRAGFLIAREDIRDLSPSEYAEYADQYDEMVMDLAVLNWDLGKDLNGITHLYDERWFTAA